MLPGSRREFSNPGLECPRLRVRFTSLPQVSVPSPIGHALAGYALTQSTKARSINRFWTSVVAVTVLANLPDVDFVLGLLVGDSDRYHRQFTHSLTAAFVVATSIGLVFRLWNRPFLRTWIFAFLVYSSHLFLDSFGHLTGDSGVQLFWPLTQAYYVIPQPVFLPIHHGGEGLRFVIGLFSIPNLVAVLWEILVLLPFVLLARAHSRRQGRQQSPMAVSSGWGNPDPDLPSSSV